LGVLSEHSGIILSQAHSHVSHLHVIREFAELCHIVLSQAHGHVSHLHVIREFAELCVRPCYGTRILVIPATSSVSRPFTQ